MMLQPLLRQSYDRKTYRTILHDILPSGTLKIFETPQPVDATCEHVAATVQLGRIKVADERRIALLEVQVSDQVKLARNRVALRNFVFQFIDEALHHAVLAVFHQPGNPDWRLTYACKRSKLDESMSLGTEQTTPRRFTFLLGRNETCKTAAGRLAELRERKENLTLEEIEKAFSVERLNKEFFKLYKQHYLEFVKYLLAPENAKAARAAFDIPTVKNGDDQDKADKPIRDFVKRLLGRLVFLYFLQRKGWLGCKLGSKAWTGGDTDFLNSHFKLAVSKKQQDHFHSKWLVPLFFEALNTPDRPGDLFPLTGTRLPYLNGGLFENDPEPVQQLDFPAELFSNLLDFFGQYHFTIDENDPEDHEVGIDPEMLGHIFENLLEDNKDKGAYYTPKAIVQYMARQSLLYYLQTHLGLEEELAVLLNEKDPSNHSDKASFVRRNSKRIAELLDEIKICDPAIGSGAFPIGLLQEILWTRLTINWELNTPEERARLKRRIIQNSIHGVDLDPGAVEIARLRFWLALVVDEDQPRPLPNLDYKIHRADSLIEYIRGEPVHLGRVSADDKRTHAAIRSLVAAKAQIFTAQKPKEKRDARLAMYRALAEVAIAEFTWLRNEMGLIAHDPERAAQVDIALEEFGYRLKLINGVTSKSTKVQEAILGQLRTWFEDPLRPTFLWQLHFGEVFEGGGFDILIGNPPYGVHLSPSHREILRKSFPEVPDVEAAYYYLSSAALLCREGGVVCLIVPNTWLANTLARRWREWLIGKFKFLELSDCSDVEIFRSAAVRNSIPLFVNGANSLSDAEDIHLNRFGDSANIVSTKATNRKFLISLLDNWLTLFTQNSDVTNLVAKMRKNSRPLGSLADVSQGLIPYDKYRGHDEETIRNRIWHSEKQLTREWRPELQGRELDRYRIVWRGKTWIKYGPWLAAPREPRFFRDPRILVREITNPRILAAYSEAEFYNTPSIINITGFRDVEAKFILAVMNSSVLSFYHTEVSPKAKKGLFPKILVDDVRKLPIPEADASDMARLGQLAEACSKAAEIGDEESFSVHESEIDEIVFNLFGLTHEEITLVKKSSIYEKGKLRLKSIRPSLRLQSFPEDAPKETPESRASNDKLRTSLLGELFDQLDKPCAQPKKSPRAMIEVRRPSFTTAVRVRRSIPGNCDKNELIALVREVLADDGPGKREVVIQTAARKLGYDRTGAVVAKMLKNAIRNAKTRGVVFEEEGLLKAERTPLDQWDLGFLKEQFLTAIAQNGRKWIKREEAVRTFARWLGFRKKGAVIEETARSLIRGLLKEGRLEKDGQDWIRRT